ncbi:MAG: DHH family phosphoesterase, partial [bacterium]|nr:DHH family phosphoesterase [bacterium]
FVNYIPHRNEEGFGFHKAAVDKLSRDGVTLIITVDVGTADNETVQHAIELGVDAIVTDHHLPNGTLPEAVAFLNPKQKGETYPFSGLCGAGVAFKLAEALLAKGRTSGKAWAQDVPEGWEKWLLDMVAIATVADMVPLTGENRVLAYYGLMVLRKSRRPGIAALCRKIRLSQSELSEDDIGFSIAPRINAASRMDSPEDAFTLLATADVSEAENAAAKLDRINNHRKAHVAAIVRTLKGRFSDAELEAPVLVAGNPKWSPALLGLAASSLVDTYQKPVCLWGREGTGTLKGSCRSDGSANIVEMLEAAGEALTQYGGHEHAGGFAVAKEAVHTLDSTLQEAYGRVATEKPELTHEADAVVNGTPLASLFRFLLPLAPFGVGNAKPVFKFSGGLFETVRTFGKSDAHVELMVRFGGSEPFRCVRFFSSVEHFTRRPEVQKRADILGTVERSTWNGASRIEVRVIDIV